MLIRKFTNDDRHELLSMMTKFYDGPALIGNVPTEIIKRNIDNCLKNNTNIFAYIFEIDSLIIGYGIVTKCYSTENGSNCVWIEDVYLKEKYRNCGLGSEFFKFVEKEFDEECIRFRLDVSSENKNAQLFYKKMGYSELGYIQMVKEK